MTNNNNSNNETKQNTKIDELESKGNSYRSIGIINPSYRFCKFTGGEISPAYTYMHKYVANIDKMLEHNLGVMVLGKVGCGKSYLCGCVANALIDKWGCGVIYANLPEIISASLDKENKWLWDSAKECKCLIIDDFGVERISDYTLEKIYELINARTGLVNAVTIVNSNISVMNNKEDLSTERIYSRIRLLCPKMLCMGGEDYRKFDAESKLKLMDGIIQ